MGSALKDASWMRVARHDELLDTLTGRCVGEVGDVRVLGEADPWVRDAPGCRSQGGRYDRELL